MKKYLALPVFGMLALCSTQSANAALILGIQADNAAAIVVLDNSVDDNLGSLNAINWAGTVGDWQAVVGTGLSKNMSAPAVMDLAFSVSYNGAGTAPGNSLYLWIIDTFDPNLGSVTGLLDGNQAGTGSVLGQMCLGDLALNGYQVSCNPTNIGPFASAQFSGIGSFTGPGTAAILQVILTANSARYSTSGDFSMRRVPEPGSIGLLGVALLGLGVIGRKKKNQRP